MKGFESKFGGVNATEDYLSPRDMDGHGTHTASTAAGRQVTDVSAIGGFAKGTATGGAPLARLAIYKACWAIPNQPKADGNTCFSEDMLAAMDDAIADGVDILSVSIGTAEPLPYNQDAIGLGALHASRRNILVVCSAGNSGPAPGTLSNPAPWILTVGASSLDRAFSSPVTLGNGLEVIVRHFRKLLTLKHLKSNNIKNRGMKRFGKSSKFDPPTLVFFLLSIHNLNFDFYQFDP